MENKNEKSMTLEEMISEMLKDAKVVKIPIQSKQEAGQETQKSDKSSAAHLSDHPLYKILYRQPNPEMTSFVFWETLMTHLLLWGNAYAQIVRDGKNTVLGLYPLLPENVEVDEMRVASFTISTTPTRMKFRESRIKTSTFAGTRSSMCRGLGLMV